MKDSKTHYDYSFIGGMGYSVFAAIAEPYTRVFREIKRLGTNLQEAKILDIGCGDGEWGRFYAELTQSPRNITGIEIEQQRIDYALKINPLINYECIDVSKFKGKFDIITANVVMMYFFSELGAVLNKIHDSLEDNGYFIWMDAEAEDHFANVGNGVPAGFSMNQMIELIRKHKFNFIQGFNIQIPGWNGKHFMVVLQKG